MPRFAQQTIVIIGATGGLGQAFAHAFAAEGADLVLVARHATLLHQLAAELPNALPFTADVTDRIALQAIADQLAPRPIAAVINAVGYDVRKALLEHTPAEIQQTLNINLQGAIFITQAFLPLLQAQHSGVITHVIGFADGRLALPYYSVDVASRAGVVAFIESVNRELADEAVKITYFSPSPTDTAAERPFHELWRSMGTRIAPLEEVAAALVASVAQRQSHIMGGWLTRTFAKLNAIAPRLADQLALRSMGRALKTFLYPTNPSKTRPAPRNLSRYVGLGLIALSFLLYGVALFLIPLLPLALEQKALFAPITAAIGEASFWIGGLFLGKELLARLRGMLNPCNWCAPRPEVAS